MSFVEFTVFSKVIDALGERFLNGLDKSKDKAQVVTVQYKPDAFSFTELGRETTTGTVEPKKPNLIFENQEDKQIVVKEISVILSDDFKTKGVLKILADKAEIFRQKKVGDFTNVKQSTITIKVGKTIKRRGKLEFYFWNEVDQTTIALTAQVTFGE